MTAPTIAVTGATGQQGGAVAKALLARNASVVAIVRDETKDAARALADAGAELRTADLTDRSATAAALQGVSAAFVMATMLGADGLDGEIKVGTTVADAARDAGVPFCVYSSVGGAERHTGIPHFDSKRRIEEHIESLGLPHSFVRPVFFMDNFASFGRPKVEDGTIVVRNPLAPDVPLQLIAVEDIGAVSAALLLAPDTAPAAVEIAGDELTGDQIATAIGRQYDLPARYEALPVESLGDSDQEAMFTWFATTPAYEGDFATTRALAPDVHTFAAWLAGAALGDLS